MMVDQTVSHYKILERLGSGGMGVVYRAEDLKLGRVVALKFLAEQTVSSAAILERFAREARAISALNHPNICTIYEIDEFDGQPFIAMEFLEGKNLDQEAAGRALPAQRIIELGIHLADGLHAAHSKGIIHRDIKPANLFVTTRGDLKILDFGLAKLTDAAAATISGTEPTPTISAENLTRPGTTIGTIAYMSPEQARGEVIDARSDLFSAGAVLYELASGQSPFTGKTSAIIFDAILNRDPVSACELNPSVPAELGRIIEKCLEKDREVRCQHAADLRADLKRLKRNSTSGNRKQTSEQPQEMPTGMAPSSSPSSERIPSATSGSGVLAAAQKHWIGTSIVLVCGLLLTGAAVFGIYELAHRPMPAPFERFSVSQETDFGDVLHTAISPDGKPLAFVRGMEKPVESLWIRQLATKSDTQVVPSFEGRVMDIAFSPDTNYIYFRIPRIHFPNARTRDLYRVPLFGGQPQLIVRDIDDRVSFTRSGEDLCFLRDAPDKGVYKFVTLNLQSGSEKIVFQHDQPYPTTAACSPDGTRIALAFDAGDVGNDLWILNVARGSIERLANLGEGQHFVESLSWFPDGSGLVFSEITLSGFRAQFWYAAYPSGALRRVTNDLGSYLSVQMSRDGKKLGLVREARSADAVLFTDAAK